MLHRENLVSDLPVGAEINVGIFSAGGSDLIQLDLLQCTLTGGSLLGFGSVRREAGDEFLQLLDLFLLLLVRLLHLLDEQLAGLVPEVIVTCIKLDLSIVNISGVGTYLVQEVTVMGYHDDGVLKVDQEVLQPCDCVEVEMVGRLVEQQNVGISEQCLCQQHLHLQITVEIAHHGIMIFGADAETV